MDIGFVDHFNINYTYHYYRIYNMIDIIKQAGLSSAKLAVSYSEMKLKMSILYMYFRTNNQTQSGANN